MTCTSMSLAVISSCNNLKLNGFASEPTEDFRFTRFCFLERYGATEFYFEAWDLQAERHTGGMLGEQCEIDRVSLRGQ